MYYYSTHVAVFFLDKFQERRHVRPAEMVDRFQTGEHAHFAQSLEVVLANVLEKREIRKNHEWRQRRHK